MAEGSSEESGEEPEGSAKKGVVGESQARRESNLRGPDFQSDETRRSEKEARGSERCDEQTRAKGRQGEKLTLEALPSGRKIIGGLPLPPEDDLGLVVESRDGERILDGVVGVADVPERVGGALLGDCFPHEGDAGRVRVDEQDVGFGGFLGSRERD